MTKVIPHIKEDYYNRIPRPNNKSRFALKLSIERDGQKTPIDVNEKGVIIDGHTRFEICEELGIKCDFVVKKYSSEQEEIKGENEIMKSHKLHYWILHKDGHRFCWCGVRK